MRFPLPKKDLFLHVKTGFLASAYAIHITILRYVSKSLVI